MNWTRLVAGAFILSAGLREFAGSANEYTGSEPNIRNAGLNHSGWETKRSNRADRSAFLLAQRVCRGSDQHDFLTSI
jgi:hypothetical protein